MTEDGFKIYLKLIQITPLKQAINNERFMPEYVVMDSKWQRLNGVTRKGTEVAFEWLRWEISNRTGIRRK